VNCGDPGCSAEGAHFKFVGSLLGWNVQIVNTDGSPQQVNNAWAQILREKPFGVFIAGFTRSLFNSSVLQAQKEGIAVLDVGTTDTVGNGVTWVDGTGFYTKSGQVMAQWVVAHSDGTPTAVFANIPDYPILTVTEQSFETTLKQLAPNSKVYTFTIPLTALGTTSPDLYTSFLRAHPGIQFVVPAYDALYDGVPAALKAAHIPSPKVVTIASTAQGIQEIDAGQIDAGTTFDDQLSDYCSIDALARLSVGMPEPPQIPYPTWIITKTNNLPPVNNFTVTTGLQQYFTHLWGKS
jgi:ABC-type sugar transport system substrate-binding protein